MPVTGSLSKSSAAESAGAKSQMSNIFLAIVVLLVLAFLAPLFQWLPEACLGAVVINAMSGSASPMKVVDFWKVDRIDFGLGVITGLVVLSSTLLKGMLVGIIFSLIYLVFRVSFPGRAELGRDDKTVSSRPVRGCTATRRVWATLNARPCPESCSTGSTRLSYTPTPRRSRQTGEQFLIDAAAKGPLPKTLVIDFEEVFYTDVSGAGALSSLHNYAKRYGVDISHRAAALPSSGDAGRRWCPEGNRRGPDLRQRAGRRSRGKPEGRKGGRGLIDRPIRRHGADT